MHRVIVGLAVAVLLVGPACQEIEPDGLREADAGDYGLADQACVLDRARIVASGVLTDRSDQARRWAVSVVFAAGEGEIGSTTARSDGEVPAGAEWRWRTEITVDPERVTPDQVRCRVDRVDVADPGQ